MDWRIESSLEFKTLFLIGCFFRGTTFLVAFRENWFPRWLRGGIRSKLCRDKKSFKINETTADENRFLKSGIGSRRFRLKFGDFLTNALFERGPRFFSKAFRGNGGCDGF